MKYTVPTNHLTGAQAASTPALRWWHLSMLLVLLLMAPKAWAQTYIIGTNQTTCAGTIYDSGGASGDYASNENLTTVLTPGTAGSKVSLTFTSFTTESTYDYLRIYNGPTASSPLIGAYTGTTSPGTVVATNATGQLTLVFTSDGSVTYAGFAATIACVTNVTSITSFTPTSGTTGATVVLTGTGFTGATSVTVGGTAVPVYTVNSDTQLTLTLPANAITGPICVTSPAGTACSSASFNTGNLVYLIGTDQTTCSGTIYDSGGANGSYANSEDLTSVLTPANGSKVILTFTAFNTESCCDYLRIYDGPSSASTLIGEYRGTTGPGTVQASNNNPTGKLTLVFHSDGSVTNPGFAANISCSTPPTCTPVTNLTVTNVTASSASLNFTPGTGNTSYTVTYTPAGGAAQTRTATASPIVLTGLVSATAYTVSIQSLCTTGSTILTTASSFTTLLPNDEPCGALNLSATPISASNVSATTSVQNGINTPSCAGGPLPKDVWFTFVANATSSTLTLTGNAAGSVRVFTTPNCSTGLFNEIFCRGSATNNTALGTVSVPGLTAGQRYYVAVNGAGSSDAAGIFTISATNVLNATKTQANTDALVVYPNPSNTGQLTIKLNELRGAGQVTLFNSLGQAVRAQGLTGAAEQTLSTQALAAGLYTLRVTVGEQVLTRKVVLE
ncbi:CUB domain-containing protein [Hymenobacter convexus]|uniref:CUB domain-containing protein n=1 Tax=Hymenobacter sp. CA1UV-4 TaxID=3063782 RepID=UPI002712D161|nr:CUB domain-containing protein [Hymenobacter sp. CA1UV-4]MDO7854462.1 T9SS type A sorting domain-containing protein [Hymenobacter sp. CA1UV-4]